MGLPKYTAKHLRELKSSYKFNKLLGWSGEALALLYFKLNFYLILHRNYRTKKGEIDLIILKHRTIHFIEVKTSLKSNMGYSNILRVNKVKQKKLKALAKNYLFTQRKDYIKYTPHRISFDIVTVNWNLILSFKSVLEYHPNYF